MNKRIVSIFTTTILLLTGLVYGAKPLTRGIPTFEFTPASRTASEEKAQIAANQIAAQQANHLRPISPAATHTTPPASPTGSGTSSPSSASSRASSPTSYAKYTGGKQAFSSTGAPLDKATNKNTATLTQSIQQGDLQSANSALEKRASLLSKEMVPVENKSAIIQAQDEAGNTHLHATAVEGKSPKVTEGRTAIAQRLKQQGADINAKNNAGTTPIVVAVQSGNVDFLQTFIKDVDLTAKDSNGRTLVSIAADNLYDLANGYNENPGKGTAGNLTNISNVSKIFNILADLTLGQGDVSNLGMINRSGISGSSKFTADCALDSNGRSVAIALSETMNALITAAKNPLKGFDLENVRNQTLTLIQAILGKIGKIEVTIEGKTYNLIDAPAPDGRTPLSIAMESGEYPFIQSILNAGASANNPTGQALLKTGVDTCITNGTPPSSFTALLLQQGAIPDAATLAEINAKVMGYRGTSPNGTSVTTAPANFKALINLLETSLGEKHLMELEKLTVPPAEQPTVLQSIWGAFKAYLPGSSNA